MAKTVVGLFEDLQHAQLAVRELESAGYTDHLSFVQNSSSGLNERLISAGIPQQDAQIYSTGLQQGGGLVILQGMSDNEAGTAADILDRHNVVDITRRTNNYSSTMTNRDTTRAGTTNLYQGGEVKVPIIEEELHVGKREVEGGGVRVNARIEEVPVSEQVTLREETVDVHRKPVSREVTDADFATLQQGSFEVVEHDEQAVVGKQARVVEEVHIKKNVEEHVENIQDTVRRTDVDVQQVAGQTRAVGSSDTNASSRNTTNTSSDEGIIERTASKLGNATERATGADLNRDGDVGKRDPRNNI
jgi:uncharacterized protein (TIGR02271 family)